MKDLPRDEGKPTISHPRPPCTGGPSDQIRSKARNAYEAGRDWERNFVKRVQEKPIQSLLIAAGVGLLGGLLWRRK